MFPFQVKARRQSITAIWNMTQDSLSLAHMWELTFGNRNAQDILSSPWHTHRLG